MSPQFSIAHYRITAKLSDDGPAQGGNYIEATTLLHGQVYDLAAVG
jgi:hypothetical protein